MVQVRDNNFASVTSDHELKQFLVVRNFNPRASVAFGVTSRVSLWLSVARCFAADSSCVTHSRNRFYVLACLVVRDLRLRFELRITRSHNLFFVFAIFELDVNFQDFVWKFFAEELEFILVLAHSHFYRENTF